MSTLIDDHDLDKVIAQLARRALIMNAGLGLGLPTSLLADQVHPVLTAGIRALELSGGTRWYAGNRRQSVTGLDRLVLGLYAESAMPAGGGLRVNSRPRRNPLAEGPLDDALVVLAQRAHDMTHILWRGGPTSQLSSVIHPVIGAAREVELHWQDRALCTPVEGILLKPAEQLAREVRDGVDPVEFARFCAEDERAARREHGVPEEVELPVAASACRWCGVQSGERHTSIDCVPPGEEVLLTLTPWPDPEPGPGGRLPLASATARAHVEVPRPVLVPSCGACGRPISPTGQCGC